MITTTRPTLSVLLDEVERIRPILVEGSVRAEAERRLTDEAWEAMVDAELFGILAPRHYGGFELPITEAMEVWEAVARCDSAAAWNLVMTSTLAAFAAWLPEAGAREIFADGQASVAGALSPPAVATRTAGGWRITGRVPFASGCHQATWLAMPAFEIEGMSPGIDPTTGDTTPLGMFFPVIGSTHPRHLADSWHAWHRLARHRGHRPVRSRAPHDGHRTTGPTRTRIRRTALPHAALPRDPRRSHRVGRDRRPPPWKSSSNSPGGRSPPTRRPPCAVSNSCSSL